SLPDLPDLPPVRYSGQLESTVRMDSPEGLEDSMQLINRLNLNLGTYIWQPWFATVDGTLVLAYSETEVGDQEASSEVVAGNATLRVFPQSRFPFELFVEVTDSRADLLNDLGGIGNEQRNTRVGFNQAYRTPSGRTSARGGYEHTEQEAPLADVSTDRIDVQFSHQFSARQRVNADLIVNRLEQKGAGTGGLESLNGALNVQHSLQPIDELTIDSAVSVSRLEFDINEPEPPGPVHTLVTGVTGAVAQARAVTEATVRLRTQEAVRRRLEALFGLDLGSVPPPAEPLDPVAEFRTNLEAALGALDLSPQGLGLLPGPEIDLDEAENRVLVSSTARWRPDDLPLLVTGRVRVDWTQNEGALGEREQLASDLELEAVYDITGDLELRGDAQVTRRSGEDDSLTTFQRAALTYAPPSIDLGGFAYDWSASLQADNQTSDTGPAVRGAGVTLTQGLSRVFPIGRRGDKTLSLSLSQSLGDRYDTDLGNVVDLNHSASLAWLRAGGGASETLNFTLTDSRRLGARDTAVTTAILQGGYQLPLGRYASVGANLTFSATRSVTEGISSDNLFSSADVNFSHARLFGVNRLRFTSEFNANSDTLVPITLDGGDGSSLVWENRLEYTIGLLDMRLRLILSEEDGRQDKSALFTITRTFGGVF
ncbi:MAG: hypothetical protein PVF91_09905, partial [Chromatiales bacterium]